MKKLWKYQFFSDVTKTIAPGAPIKEPYVWSETTPGGDYADITTTEAILDRIKKNYEKFEVDGVVYFKQIRADLVLLLQSGQKTLNEIYQIEAMLAPVTERIVRGDWMTAKNELLKIIPVPPLDEEKYNEILTSLTAYIVENY